MNRHTGRRSRSTSLSPAREPRKPFFLGDLPHAWVASDYVRSVLDMFAYERESDRARVIGAGIPDAWLDGEGVSVRGLRTPYGELDYSLPSQSSNLAKATATGLSSAMVLS